MRSKLSLARIQVDRLRSVLLTPSPEKIEQCLPGLAEALACLGEVQRSLGVEAADPELGRELKVLKNDLNAVRKLIEHGAEFYQGWAKLLGSATSGYTPTGDAAPISAAGTVSIRG
jgi:hypothetical protein